MSIRLRARAWILPTAVALALFGLLAYWTTSSAIGVVIDLRRAGAALAALAVLLLVLDLGSRLRHPPPRRGIGTRIGALVLALLVTGLWADRLLLVYQEEEVRFRNGPIELAGTLYVPRAAEPCPAVLIVHGAGSGLRKEYEFYARLFARHGIAGLAYDKRGTGASTGQRWEADYQILSDDAAAGLEFLRAHRGIDPHRVGIMGISEGEWVGLLAAVDSGDAAFLAVVSPSGRSPADQVLYEVGESLRRRGFDPATIRRALDLNRRLFDFVRTNEGGEALSRDLDRVSREPWYAAAKLPDGLGSPSEWAWWRTVMDFDPLPVWSRVRCPVLLLSGGRDPKNPAADSQERICRALAAGGNDRVTTRIFPEAEHGLVVWWLPAHLPPPRFARGYLDVLVHWVEERTGSARHGSVANPPPQDRP